ncbi:MAG: ABC transporter permease, partial [Beijerinckiaceae bacterium]
AVFLMQSGSLLEAASTLGAGQSRIFFRVALPLARPSIAAGSALALMEALNDIGASEFLGVRTLSVAIFSTWINRSSLPGAAQIGLALLAIVVGLVLIERWARRNQQYATSARSSRSSSRLRLSAGRGLLVAGLAFLPIFVGFLAPVSYLAIEAGRRIATFGVTEEIVSGARNSMTVAFLVMVATIAAGLLMAFVVRIRRGPVAETCLRISMLGYAMPGTVLAVGLVSSLGALDNAMAFVLERFFGLAPGLLLTGSGAAIVYACAVRFLAIPAGGLDAALTKTPISLDHAARSLGATNMRILRRIHLPLLRPAILSAGLLVFVDCMKELPATLLLRPLNFETLATHLYAEASRGVYEDGSVAALAIVLFALLPVALLAGLTRSPVSSRADSRMSGMAVIRP